MRNIPQSHPPPPPPPLPIQNHLFSTFNKHSINSWAKHTSSLSGLSHTGIDPSQVGRAECELTITALSTDDPKSFLQHKSLSMVVGELNPLQHSCAFIIPLTGHIAQEHSWHIYVSDVFLDNVWGIFLRGEPRHVGTSMHSEQFSSTSKKCIHVI